MSLKKGPKAGALVPESDSALSSILKKLGVLVKNYRDLDDFESIREIVQGLDQEELIFLFCNIEEAYPPLESGQMDILNIIEARKKNLANENPYVFSYSDKGSYYKPDDEPIVKMALGLTVKDRLHSIMADGSRKKIEVVMRLPRKSELLEKIPPGAHFLANDFEEKELGFLLNLWTDQAMKAADEVREEIRKMAPKELGILIAHENPIDRTILKQQLLRLLNIADENILEAGDDSTALEKFFDPKADKIKLLFAGGSTPSLDGLGLLEIAKKDRTDIGRVLLTSENDDSTVDIDTTHHRLDLPVTGQKLFATLIECFRDIKPSPNIDIFKKFDEEEMFPSTENTLPTDIPRVATPGRITPLPLSRITPLPSIPKRILISNGSSYRGSVDMGKGDDLPDVGRSLDNESSTAKRLTDAVTASLFKNGEHMGLMETILLAAEEKQNIIVEKEGGISYLPENHQNQEEVENVEILGKKFNERHLMLRLLDRENAVQILARYKKSLDLSKYSQPKTQYDPSAVKRFEGNEQINELLPSNDWTISRDVEASSKVLGVGSLVNLMKLAIETAHPKKYREPNIIGFGNGDCKIMDELAAAYTDRKVRHLTIGRSILFNLSDLLDRSLSKELPEEEVVNFKKFNIRITHLLQRHFGRFGRLEIKLNLPDDQVRLRDYLIRLAEKSEVQGYAAGKRKTAATTGKYADDKWERLTDGEIHYFAEYVKDPQAFFSKYYGAFFNAQSPQDINDILGLEKRDMIFGDFRDMPELLKNCGNFITFAYSVKGDSHLEDYDYGVAFNEVAARLLPGGILINDGVVESHTWSHRIHELREALRNLNFGKNGQYRIYLIGNQKGPVSVACQRGVPNGLGGYGFTLSEGIELRDEEPMKLINLGDRKKRSYEAAWPEAALRNKLIYHIKDLITDALVNGIVDKKLRLECTETWRQTTLKVIDPLFNDIFDRIVASWKNQSKHRGGSFDKEYRINLSNKKNVARLLELFEEKTKQSLGSYVENLLLKLYPFGDKKESA